MGIVDEQFTPNWAQTLRERLEKISSHQEEVIAAKIDKLTDYSRLNVKLDSIPVPNQASMAIPTTPKTGDLNAERGSFASQYVPRNSGLNQRDGNVSRTGCFFVYVLIVVL